MVKESNWEWISLGAGYGEVKLRSWKQFSDFINTEMLDYETYVWRGQRCYEWSLESTLDRLVKRAKVEKSMQYGFQQAHLDQFKFAVRGRRGANPPKIESENEWWALGQHHGLATPLLDWTTSPFVVAYFAFINQGENQSEQRAIYALHRPTVENKVKEKIIEMGNRKAEQLNDSEKKGVNTLASLSRNLPARPEVEFIRPLSDENQRLVNQGGLFTRSPRNKSLDAWVKENFGSETGYTLIKISIPNADREECLRMLNRMNINHLTLFPDLYGASKFCNLFGEIEKY